MKVLLLYDYPPPPGGLATQGDYLRKGLRELGVEVRACSFKSAFEKRWNYLWFNPDIVVGVGYWGHTPQIVLHPMQHDKVAIPWLVADGVVLDYQNILNTLPLILVTSNWVKERFVRDGIKEELIDVLPVGLDTDSFIPYSREDERVKAVRKSLGIDEDEMMILTIGGDAASKGTREVMEALSLIKSEIHTNWKYVIKVWPQQRTEIQNRMDIELAESLGILNNIIIKEDIISRDFVPFLLSACDIYAGPSRLEGFGMVQVEANACGKPVLGIKAMGLLDTIIDGETGFLARVGEEIKVENLVVGEEHGFPPKTLFHFDPPKVIDYRADSKDLAKYLKILIENEKLRKEMGEKGVKRAREVFDYRVVAKQFLSILKKRGLCNE